MAPFRPRRPWARAVEATSTVIYSTMANRAAISTAPTGRARLDPLPLATQLRFPRARLTYDEINIDVETPTGRATSPLAGLTRRANRALGALERAANEAQRPTTAGAVLQATGSVGAQRARAAYGREPADDGANGGGGAPARPFDAHLGALVELVASRPPELIARPAQPADGAFVHSGARAEPSLPPHGAAPAPRGAGVSVSERGVRKGAIGWKRGAVREQIGVRLSELRSDTAARALFSDDLRESERLRLEASCAVAVHHNIASAWLTPSPSQLAPIRARELEAAHAAASARLAALRELEEAKRARTLAKLDRTSNRREQRAGRRALGSARARWLVIAATVARASALLDALKRGRHAAQVARATGQLCLSAQHIGAAKHTIAHAHHVRALERFALRFRLRLRRLARRASACTLRAFFRAVRKAPPLRWLLAHARSNVHRLQRWWRGQLAVARARADILMRQLLVAERRVQRARRRSSALVPVQWTGHAASGTLDSVELHARDPQPPRLGRRIERAFHANVAESIRLAWVRESVRTVAILPTTRDALVHDEVRRRVLAYRQNVRLYRAQLKVHERVCAETVRAARARAVRGLKRTRAQLQQFQQFQQQQQQYQQYQQWRQPTPRSARACARRAATGVGRRGARAAAMRAGRARSACAERASTVFERAVHAIGWRRERACWRR